MIGIVVVGYNRPDCVERLLNNLSICNYDGDTVDLIISIDKGQRQADIVKIAESYDWLNGTKTVRAYEVRQGLKTHIFSCGNLTEKYDAIILLEDDLMVSVDFYRYAKAALDFYGNDERIAGISLYKHRNNIGGCRYFEPCENGSDTFLIQYAQSWGQCWNKRMWKEFAMWYDQYGDSALNNKKLPPYLRQWKSSWLKYNIAFCILMNKYFVYPYTSLSTNCSEIGEHSINSSADYQVPILYGSKKYQFNSYKECIRYDGFFEREDILESIQKEYGDRVVLDLYGTKNEYGDARYLISVQAKPYKIVDSYSLTFRPHEQNITNKVHGKGIYVYDITQQSVLPKKNNLQYVRYDMRDYPARLALQLSAKRYVQWLKDGIHARIKRVVYKLRRNV